jgi:CRISPR-associated exonuclease Cas4
MFSDEELLPISALQHLLFCQRQCALIHIERLWAENPLTVEGQRLHRKAHEGSDERRGGLRIVRGLSLRSLRLGVVGKADVVEFHPPTKVDAPSLPFPVEYKRGKPKSHEADKVQLCAQALCLEEMLGVSVPAGALYYGRTRRRRLVPFDHTLRKLTEEACDRLHTLVSAGVTPPALRERKCDSCSLLHLCLPDATGSKRSAAAYFARNVKTSLATLYPAGNP